MVLPFVQVGVRDPQELIDDPPIKLDESAPNGCGEVIRPNFICLSMCN